MVDDPKTPGAAGTPAPSPNAKPHVPRALWPSQEPPPPDSYRALVEGPTLAAWFAAAHPLETTTLHVRLKPLDQPDGDPVVTPPIARDNPDARRASIAAYRRVQVLRFGETLSRLRALVTLNIRGDDVPMGDVVIATGSAEAFRSVVKLEGVAAIFAPPEAPKVR